MEQTDTRSSRLTIWFVGIGMLMALAIDGLLVAVALGKPSAEVAAYLVGIAGFSALAGVLVGGLVNAMNTRSGGKIEDLERSVALTRAPTPAKVEAGITHTDVENFKRA